MDTDDLTPMAYETLSKAFAASEVLRAELGASAAECRTENDFLRGTLKYLDEILEDPEEYLDSWNLLDDLTPERFSAAVKRVRCHVQATLATDQRRRGKAPFAS